MVDTPTIRNRFRKQETGTNNNSWGIKLNQVLDCVDQVTDGVESIDLGGLTSYTLTTTNYTTDDQAKNRVLYFTNANASGTEVILPSVEHTYTCINAAGYNVTPKTSAGTGVAIPTGYQAFVYCDAVNVVNGSPTFISGAVKVAGKIAGVSNAAALDEATPLGQVEDLIAAAISVGSPGTVKIDVLDTTGAFLAAKMTSQIGALTTTQVAGLTSLQFSTLNPSGNEQLALVLGAGYVGNFLPGGTKTSQFTPVIGTEYNCDFTSGSWTINLSGMTTPQVGQRIKLNCFGNYKPFMLGTYNSVANQYLLAGFNGELCFSGNSWGWN